MSNRLVVRRFYLYSFLSGIHFSSAVIRSFFVEWGGVDLVVAQTLQSWFTFCIFLLEVPTGVVADSWGRKHSVAIGCAVMGLGALTYGIYPHLWLFVLAEFLFAAGIAFISGADRAWLYDYLTESGRIGDSKSVVGRSHAIRMLGMLVSAPTGSFIAQTLGLNFPMLLTCLPLFLAALVAWNLPEPKIHLAHRERRNYLKLARESLMFLKNHKILARWTVNMTLVSTAGYFVIWTYQPLLYRLEVPLAWYGVAHSGLVLSEIFFAALYGPLARLFGSSKKLYSTSAWLVAAAFLAAALYPSLFTLALFLILAGGIGLTRGEFMTFEMNKHIDERNRATVQSSINMFRRISTAILNPGAGVLIQSSVLLALFVIGLIPVLTKFFPLNGEDHHE